MRHPLFTPVGLGISSRPSTGDLTLAEQSGGKKDAPQCPQQPFLLSQPDEEHRMLLLLESKKKENLFIYLSSNILEDSFAAQWTWFSIANLYFLRRYFLKLMLHIFLWKHFYFRKWSSILFTQNRDVQILHWDESLSTFSLKVISIPETPLPKYLTCTSQPARTYWDVCHWCDWAWLHKQLLLLQHKLHSLQGEVMWRKSRRWDWKVTTS